MHVYVLYHASAESRDFANDPNMLGVFSSLEAAQTEATRYNKRTQLPLEWKECISDRPRQITPNYWFARLTTYYLPTDICISKHKLDGKAFRP